MVNLSKFKWIILYISWRNTMPLWQNFAKVFFSNRVKCFWPRNQVTITFFRFHLSNYLKTAPDKMRWSCQMVSMSLVNERKTHKHRRIQFFLQKIDVLALWYCSFFRWSDVLLVLRCKIYVYERARLTRAIFGYIVPGSLYIERNLRKLLIILNHWPCRSYTK